MNKPSLLLLLLLLSSLLLSISRASNKLTIKNKRKKIKNKKNKNLASNTETPNFVAFFVFKGGSYLFILRISSSENEAKREAIFSRMSVRGE